MKPIVVIVAIFVLGASAQESWDSQGVKLAMRVYDECSGNADGFSPCLKKKAVTFLNRLGRMDKLNLVDGFTVVRTSDAPAPVEITDEQLEQSLPRAGDARDSALDTMIMDKLASVVSSWTLQVTMPKVDLTEEGINNINFYIFINSKDLKIK